MNPSKTYTIESALCSLGAVAIAESENGLAAVALADSASEAEEEIAAMLPNSQMTGKCYESTLKGVFKIIEDPTEDYGGPLDLTGTEFQFLVWQALREIPAGETRTYGELSAILGRPEAVRAVIGANGSLTGYRWGIERKARLLEREAPVELLKDAVL